MGVNRAKPYLYVIPEDRANATLANGFHAHIGRCRQMQVLEEADGWTKAVENLKGAHFPAMEFDQNRFVVWLIDCDGKPERLDEVRADVPSNLADRVFVLGARTNPEKLGVGDKETFGGLLAEDCRDGTSKAWGHELLKHNAVEVDRLRKVVSSILF
jgi:hypothetical protein